MGNLKAAAAHHVCKPPTVSVKMINAFAENWVKATFSTKYFSAVNDTIRKKARKKRSKEKVDDQKRRGNGKSKLKKTRRKAMEKKQSRQDDIGVGIIMLLKNAAMDHTIRTTERNNKIFLPIYRLYSCDHLL